MDKSLLDTLSAVATVATPILLVLKSMGNETSKLDRWEMIEWFMTDAPKIKATHEASKHA